MIKKSLLGTNRFRQGTEKLEVVGQNRNGTLKNVEKWKVENLLLIIKNFFFPTKTYNSNLLIDAANMKRARV